MNSFSDRLVLARERAGLTQKRMAELLEITPTRLNYWEKGKREPNVLMIKNISKILNVSSDYLIFGTESINNFSSQEISVLNKYRKLNDIGKPKAETYIDDLLINDKYTEDVTIQEKKPLRRTPSLREAMEMQKPRPIRSDRLDDDGYERIAAYGRGVHERKKKE